MVTVEANPAVVEVRLVGGRLACPGWACGGVLRPWGWARSRVLRDFARSVVVRPRRGRCGRCGRSHVLLPVIGLLRRADLVEVIGAALVAKAKGVGARVIAAWLGRPMATVRGWLRRFAERAEALRVVFTLVGVAVGIDPSPPAATGSATGDAVAAIVGAAVAVGSRWPLLGVVSPWRVACTVTGGRLLASASS